MQLLRKIGSFLLFTLSAINSFSQQAFFNKFTIQDGLVANPIRCVYQDSKGFIWIGTIDGLSKYDGYKFTNYTASNGLSHSYINSIFEVGNNVLVGENNGSVDVIRNNSIIKVYKAGSAINFIERIHDRLLFSSDENGFYEFKKDSFFLPRQKNFDHAHGAMLALGDSLLLTAAVDNYFFLYDKNLNLAWASTFFNFTVHSLFRDSKQRIWACSMNGLKLLAIKPGDEQAVSVAPLPAEFNFDPLITSPVTSIVEEEDGSFWIGTYKGLVHLFKGGRFHVYNEKDGLPSGRINSLYLDKEKNLWIGTSLGLAKWVSKNNIAFFTTESQDFRSDVVGLSVSGNQKVILLTDHGLQEFNFDTKEFKDIPLPAGGPQQPALIAGTSPILVHNADRIMMLDNKTNKVLPVEKLDTALTGILATLQHSQGKIFLGTFDGLYATNKSSVTKILPYRITSLTLDGNGDVWVGTWVSGLYRVTINNSQGSYDTVNMTSLIKEKQIRGLFTDRKKNIWVGTRYGGAFCLTATSNNNFAV
ncbi:MAG TPA: two-component regulator propeller domain-containing protein, partial [Chitinophagaceae bacterium]